MNESKLFARLLELVTPEERAAFLDEVCAADPRLRADLEALWQAHATNPEFLEQPVSPIEARPEREERDQDSHAESSPDSGPVTRTPTEGDVTPAEGPGAVIGPYKLVQEIGEGGMGTVYVAQQTEPVKRLVALKLIKPGMDSKQVLARFDAERQALALMDHPNIAKVLDAGTSEAHGPRAAGFGRPYFVMELVKGVPITKFCDQRRLTPRQRLELFVPVCQAIQHAHQKGIIHRDIKPSNVLVALYDDRPVPKVIDFGVAKATGRQLTEQTLNTAFGSVVGTLEYMSPEQATFNQLDVDTRSDIYSLGVLLYELLAGSPPFSRRELEKAGMLEMFRLIREQEPSKPSTKLSTADGLPTLAANRAMEPAKLTKLLRGELDWIVMKALEKERTRRYETASAFAADVQRYLDDEPVQACPPSAWYRLRKFARRNKRMLLSTGLVLAAVVLATVLLAISYVRVREERDQKEQALRDKAAALKVAQANFRMARAAVDRSFTVISEDDLFETAGLEPVRKKLLEGALQYYKEFVEQEPEDPELLAELATACFRIRQMYRSLDRYADSLVALRTGLDICERLRRSHPGNTKILDTFASIRYTQLRFAGSLHAQYDATDSVMEEAKKILERSTAFWESLVAEYPRIPNFQRNLGEAYDELAMVQRASQNPAAALEVGRKAFAVWEKLGREHPTMVASGREKEYAGAMLAVFLRQGGHPEEAQKLFQSAIDYAEKLVADHPMDRRHRSSLAFLYRRMGESFTIYGWQPKEAEQAWLRATSLYESLMAEFPAVTSYPWHLGDCCRKLGLMFQGTGRPQEAELYYAKAANLFEKLASLYTDSTWYMAEACRERLHLAQVHIQLKKLDDAIADLREAVRIELPSAEERSGLAHRQRELALALSQVGRQQEAVAWAKKAVELDPKQALCWNTLGAAQYRAGNWKAAIAALDKSRDLRQGGDAFDFFFLAMAHWQLCQKDDALKWHKQAVEWVEKNSEALAKNPQWTEELRRFRNEAEEVLELKKQQ